MKARPPLAITEDAARLVCMLACRDGLPAGAGLRITVNPQTSSMSMGMAAAAEPADATVTHEGAVLFLSAPIVVRTNGRTLCAKITGTDSTFFFDP